MKGGEHEFRERGTNGREEGWALGWGVAKADHLNQVSVLFRRPPQTDKPASTRFLRTCLLLHMDHRELVSRGVVGFGQQLTGAVGNLFEFGGRGIEVI